MKVSLVAAVARNGVIGRDGRIPWHLPEDLARFRAVTMGHPVIMGRRTWESIPDRFRPLPGRRNVVVTRNPRWTDDGAERAGSLEGALDLLEGASEVFVIGGAELYRAAIPLADELLLTEIDEDVDGDTSFPEWSWELFEEASREEHVTASGTRLSFVAYRRRPADLETAQLDALEDVNTLLERAGVAYWLFGGWAVDFYAGAITRPHDDVDLAVWLHDVPQVTALLEGDGWRHAPSPDDDGGTGFERGPARLELTFLVREDDATIFTPLRDQRAPWPERAFADDVRELHGVRAHVIALEALTRGKSSPRGSRADTAKDRADFDVLSGL